MVRLQINLERDEAKRLWEWAHSELREPRDQLRYILREALDQRYSQGGVEQPATQGEEHPTNAGND